MNYISATAFGYLSTDIHFQTSSYGKAYARFIIGVKNPTKDGKFSWIECTTWDETTLTKMKTFSAKRGDEIMCVGQLFLDQFGNKSYLKMYVRDFMLNNTREINVNEIPEIMAENPNDVKKLSETNQLGNSEVKTEDFDKNF